MRDLKLRFLPVPNMPSLPLHAESQRLQRRNPPEVQRRPMTKGQGMRRAHSRGGGELLSKLRGPGA